MGGARVSMLWAILGTAIAELDQHPASGLLVDKLLVSTASVRVAKSATPDRGEDVCAIVKVLVLRALLQCEVGRAIPLAKLNKVIQHRVGCRCNRPVLRVVEGEVALARLHERSVVSGLRVLAIRILLEDTNGVEEHANSSTQVKCAIAATRHRQGEVRLREELSEVAHKGGVCHDRLHIDRAECGAQDPIGTNLPN